MRTSTLIANSAFCPRNDRCCGQWAAPLPHSDRADRTLDRFYGQVVIPEAVLRELLIPVAPLPVREWLSQAPPWLRVENVPPDRVESVAAELDPGERQAIALANFLGADLLLIDELAGRAEARRLGIRVTGTLGVLRTAAEMGLIDVPQTLARLRATTFFVDEKLIAAVFGPWLTGAY